MSTLPQTATRPKTHRRSRRQPPAPTHFGLLLTVGEAALYLGVSVTRFCAVRDLDPERFPAPVKLPGPNALELYRREDLDAYVRSLRPVERQLRGLVA